jgi:hypothetical protein
VLLPDLFSDGGHVGLARGIRLDSGGRTAQLGDGCAERFLAAAGDVDEGAFLNQALGEAKADALAPAGDERDPPLQY